MLIGEIFDEFISVIHENQKYVIGIINENKEVTLCSDKIYLGTLLILIDQIRIMSFLK